MLNSLGRCCWGAQQSCSHSLGCSCSAPWSQQHKNSSFHLLLIVWQKAPGEGSGSCLATRTDKCTAPKQETTVFCTQLQIQAMMHKPPLGYCYTDSLKKAMGNFYGFKTSTEGCFTEKDFKCSSMPLWSCPQAGCPPALPASQMEPLVWDSTAN